MDHALTDEVLVDGLRRIVDHEVLRVDGLPEVAHDVLWLSGVLRVGVLRDQLVAYSPLAQTEVFDDPVIQDVAADHDASPAQVCLAWLRQRGAVPIPKATSREHVEDNYGSLEVELSDEAMERIDGVKEEYRVVDFDGVPWDLVA